MQLRLNRACNSGIRPAARAMDSGRHSDTVATRRLVSGDVSRTMPSRTHRNFLTVDPEDNIGLLKGLSSPVRIKILRLLHANGPMNVNEISAALSLPQSTVATN